MSECIISFKCNAVALNNRYKDEIVGSLTKTLTGPQNVIHKVAQYMPFAIPVEIWSGINCSGVHNVYEPYASIENNKVISQLSSQFSWNYIWCHTVAVNSDSDHIHVAIPKRELSGMLLFAVISQKNDEIEILDLFERIVIRGGNSELLNITVHDLEVMPYLKKSFYGKRAKSVDADIDADADADADINNFELIQDWSIAGSHPNIYVINLNKHIYNQLHMADEYDYIGDGGSNAETYYIDFFINSVNIGANAPLSASIYMELIQ
jgi:hypothetical protein